LAPYVLLNGCRSCSRRQYSALARTSVTISSGQVAVPWTRTSGAPTRPLAVGSLNSIATRPSRRTLYAFCGSAIDVVMRNVPSGFLRVAVGQAIGTPVLLRVANSHVR
jgi:hypothetical protein